MLFNPMTEANSYVILAPAMGVWAAWFLFAEVEHARWLGWGLLGMVLSMGLLPNVVRPLFGNYFALFWHPCLTIVFLTLITWFVWPAPVLSDGQLSVQSGAEATLASPGS